MTTIIAEGPTLSRLEEAHEPVQVATSDGRVLGVFTPVVPKPVGEDSSSSKDALSLMNE